MKYKLVYYPVFMVLAILFPILMTVVMAAIGALYFIFAPWYFGIEFICKGNLHGAFKVFLVLPLVAVCYVLATLAAALAIIVWALLFIGYYVFLIMLLPIIAWRFCKRAKKNLNEKETKELEEIMKRNVEQHERDKKWREEMEK